MKNKISRVSIPYFIWLGFLVLLPTIVLLVLAFARTNGMSFDGFEFTFDNFKTFFIEQRYYLKALWNSVVYGVAATTASLIIAYPVAYYIATLKTKKKNLILLLIILPMWSNMLLRVISWEAIFLEMNMIGTRTAVIASMVSIYLPFMLFPIYTSLEKVDKSLIEAAKDLGSNNVQVFSKVVIPLTMPGIMSGVIMVLLPSMTAFAIPDRLSGGKLVLIGNIIESKFKIGDFNMLSFISLALLSVILLFMLRSKGGIFDEE